jgi:hypothetical protein
MLTLSQGIVFKTGSSAPSMSKLNKSTVGFPRAIRTLEEAKNILKDIDCG